MNDLQKTQHYTTKSEEICYNLIQYIPEGALLIEPFVGEGDLKNIFPNHDWEVYDIDPKVEAITQDTLLEPPSYKGKWVITNPPYLAKNKATDKTIFDKYGLDDLYKVSLETALEADGGIFIIPTNFFTDERTISTRVKFLSTFEILEVNIYTEPIFETTTYSVCAFAFKRKENITEQTFKVNIKPKNEVRDFTISKQYGFRFAGDFFAEVAAITPKFSRLMKDREVPEGKYITNIKLYAIDTRSDKIRLEYEPELYYGINTDRSYATLVSDVPLTEQEQKDLIDNFNKELNAFRNQYSDLVLTNYRDYNRKRIGFDFAYRLATKQL